MKGLVPLLGAGGTFAGCAILGFALGIWADLHTGARYYTLLGLFLGMGAGGYAAVRLLLRAL